LLIWFVALFTGTDAPTLNVTGTRRGALLDRGDRPGDHLVEEEPGQLVRQLQRDVAAGAAGGALVRDCGPNVRPATQTDAVVVGLVEVESDSLLYSKNFVGVTAVPQVVSFLKPHWLPKTQSAVGHGLALLLVGRGPVVTSSPAGG
jgi:hypothetical protein